MGHYGWLTDIHLNFLEEPQCGDFIKEIAQRNLDGILIAGDIAEGHTIEIYLRRIARYVACPVYFVLGNHDFYFSNFADVHKVVRELCRLVPNLYWLNEAGVVALTDQTALVGYDGWADGRFGSFFESDVEMTDYYLIEDLAKIDRETRFAKLNALGDECAAYFERVLPEALRTRERVVLVTHVPPFREACRYEGQISDDNHLPHFACRALGEALLAIMQDFPDNHLTVLCGHTHGQANVEMAPNLIVKTGGAEYNAPVIQEDLTL